LQELAGGEALSVGVAGVVTQFARTARGHINPTAAAVGGIAAQEVLKAITHKFMPLRQWLYLDAAESLPFAPSDTLPADELTPLGGRYDGQIAVVGRAMQVS